MPSNWRALVVPGCTLALGAILLAAAHDWLLGPMLGRLGWLELSIILFIEVVLVCLALASARGEQNPYKRVSPGGPVGPFGGGGYAPPGSDPRTYYFPATTPLEPHAHATGDNRWFWWAAPSAIAAVVLLIARLL